MRHQTFSLMVVLFSVTTATAYSQAPRELTDLRAKQVMLAEADEQRIEEFVQYYANQLKQGSLQKQLEAREALVRNASGGPKWYVYAQKCNDHMLPLIQGDDNFAALQAAIALAKLGDEAAFESLKAGLDPATNSAAVRYWCVRGLANANLDILNRHDGILALSEITKLALEETSPHIVAEYFKVYKIGNNGLADIDRDKFAALMESFLTLLETRIARFGKRNQPLHGCVAELAAIPVITAMIKTDVVAKVAQKRLIDQLAKLMSWAGQHYHQQFDQFSEHQQLQLERLILRCYDGVKPAKLGGPDVAAALKELDRDELLLRIYGWTGAAGVEGVLNQKFGLDAPSPLQ